MPLKSSASLLSNNLDVCQLPGKGPDECKLAVIHKSVVWVFTPKEVHARNNADSALPYKQVFCKGENSQFCSTILQAKWCVFPQRTLLILSSIRGIQAFEDDGSLMVFWQALAPNPIEGQAQYARGISVVGTEHVSIGVADGSVLVFHVPIKGPGIKLQETLNGHSHSICDIASDGDMMVTSDEVGKIIKWKAGGHFTKISEINGFGYPCSSICLLNDLVIGGYGSGHIRVFNSASGVMLAEVCAHSRWINAMDISQESGLLVSASEDSYVRVWKITHNPFNLEFLHEESITDVQLVGAKFLDKEGSTFAVTGYDSNEAFIFSK